MRVVTARAPTRMDFGGGWTDVPPYSEFEGGVVCSVAIARYAVATAKQRPPELAGDRTRAGPPQRRTGIPVERNAPLIEAALRRERLADHVDVEVHSDFPVAAGLGGSSATSAALLGALDTWRGVAIDRVAVAERGRQIEVEDLGIAGGRQDHYAATHGGLLALTFTHLVQVQPISMAPALRRALEQRCVLVYTGESHVSGDTITAVLEGYRAGHPRVTMALSRMRGLAQSMVAALERADVESLGALVGEHWAHQRALHPSIPTPRIDAIVETARRAGALGAKAMGASGGGCVLVVARAGQEDALRAALANLGELVSFTIDEEGLVVCERNVETS